MTIGYIVMIEKKSFQVENKEAECSDTKGTILGQKYSKGEGLFQRGPFQNVTSLKLLRSDQRIT